MIWLFLRLNNSGWLEKEGFEDILLHLLSLVSKSASGHDRISCTKHSLSEHYYMTSSLKILRTNSKNSWITRTLHDQNSEIVVDTLWEITILWRMLIHWLKIFQATYETPRGVCKRIQCHTIPCSTCRKVLIVVAYNVSGPRKLLHLKIVLRLTQRELCRHRW